VKQCIAVLSQDVLKSHSILQVTYEARALAWKRSVWAALRESLRNGAPEEVPESAVSMTSGVPKRRQLLQEMVLNMADEEPAVYDDIVELEISHVVSLRQEEILERPRRSPSAEAITIPDMSSSDESAMPSELWTQVM
jgi:hypothetical protein